MARTRRSAVLHPLSGYLLACLILAWSSSLSAADLRIAYNSQWYPYSYGEDAEVRGILVEMLDRLLGERLGYSLQHRGYPWSRVQHYVEAGEQDAFFTFPSDQRLGYADRASVDVFRVESRAFVRKGSLVAALLSENPDVAGLGDARICVMLGDNWSENFYRERGVGFEYGRDTRNCLEQVAHDRADLFIHATASSLANIGRARLDEQVDMLPTVYSSIPLTLLVGKQVAGREEILRRFDALITEMQVDGSLTQLIDQLRSASWAVTDTSD